MSNYNDSGEIFTEGKKVADVCDMCAHYVYDELEDYYYCDVNLDEDDMSRFMRGAIDNCAYFSLEDEYKLARKQ